MEGAKKKVVKGSRLFLLGKRLLFLTVCPSGPGSLNVVPALDFSALMSALVAVGADWRAAASVGGQGRASKRGRADGRANDGNLVSRPPSAGPGCAEANLILGT